MKVYQGFADKSLNRISRAIAIGVFDGVHLGHQKILSSLLLESNRRKISPMIITFDPNPNKILKPQKNQPVLISLAHRLQFFKKMGVREVLVIQFNKTFAKISRENFLIQLLIGKLGMNSLSVGQNFRFGSRGLGDSRYLKAESRINSFRLHVIHPVKIQGMVVSSTKIRNYLEKGDLLKAERMLGRPASVYGTVVHGRSRGGTLGFPTANLNPHHEALPPDGVYAAQGFFDGRKMKAVVHIGRRPTFLDKEKTVEAHFIGIHKNLYGKDIELQFIKKLRDIRKFRDKSALISAIQKDIKLAKSIV